MFCFYIGEPFTTTDPSEIEKVLKRSNLTVKSGRNRSTSPDASIAALEKRSTSRKASRSLSPLTKTTIIVKSVIWLTQDSCFCFCFADLFSKDEKKLEHEEIEQKGPRSPDSPQSPQEGDEKQEISEVPCMLRRHFCFHLFNVFVF